MSADASFSDDILLGVLTPSWLLTTAILLFSAGLTCLAVVSIRAEYYDFLSLGPGGTPSTFAGFLRVKYLSLFAFRNPYAAGPVPKDSKWSYLTTLPRRTYPRPLTKGIAPHRQLNQRPDKSTWTSLATGIEQMARENSRDLAIGTSCYEKHGTGLFSRRPAVRTCQGEIVHLHASDGSMHVVLHPSDAKVVLDAGWGERHPLAGVFKKYFTPQLPVGFLMLYAPQNEEEVGIILDIIAAAAAYVHGGEVGAGKKQTLGLKHASDMAAHAASIMQ